MGVGTVPLANSTPMSTNTQIGRRSRTRRRRQAAQVEGEVTIRRRELLAEITSTASATSTSGTKYLYPDTGTTSAQMPWLSSLAKNFDRMRWNSMHLYWKPAVSASTSGQVALGVDWNQSGAHGSLSAVLSLSPSRQCALWCDMEAQPIVLPRSRLQAVNWYQIGSGAGYQRGPAYLEYWITHDSVKDAKVLGSIWVDYNVTLQGTAASS